MKWKPEYTVLSIIAGLVITIIVMAFVWSKHKCPTPNYKEIDRVHQLELDSLNHKIHNYEKQILIEKINISNYSDSELDSIWSVINR